MNKYLGWTSVFLMLFGAAGCLALPPAPLPSPTPDRTKPPIQHIEVGDISVAYRDYGTGEPLVLIMGYAGTMDTWNPDLIAPLAQTYRVIAFDNRGMGGTTAGARDFTIEQFAEDTAAFMDAVGVSRAHVLAWSMGTNIALELALRHPDKVNRLILYAGDAGGREAILPPQAVLDQLTDTSGTPEEQGRRLMGLLAPPAWLAEHGAYLCEIFGGPQETPSPENIAKQAAAMAKWPGAFARLPSIKSPTLLITGTEDVITPPANSLQMVGRISGAWLIQLPGAGHGAMYQYPSQMARLVREFLVSP